MPAPTLTSIAAAPAAEAETVRLPVARVAVDLPISHLDRPFDYRVTSQQDASAVPGARVRVRFAGRLRDGYVLERVADSDHVGDLAPLHKVVSAEPVLTPQVRRLLRGVADHYAGTFFDVLRLAVPPRHAATEQAAALAPAELPANPPASPLAGYPTGEAYLAALASGGRPRAYWQLTPTAGPAGDWAAGLAAAARATAESGRGAVIVVPDARDLQRLRAACRSWCGPAGFVVLESEAGPAARYRAFLAALRGQVRVVIGNRAAAYAPVRDLGLVALWDDGDDLLAEPRAPYPHAREVLALRAAQEHAGVLFAGYGRTAEVQRWVATGWMRELAEPRPAVRRHAPRIKVTADSDRALERDPLARAARLPREVFELMRGTLPQGPVLVQVPRGGYLDLLVCTRCREPARCRWCSGPCRAESGGGPPSCRWCGRPQVEWTCASCGGHDLRAPVVGAKRTAEELGLAFPQTPIRSSVGGRVLEDVPDTSAIVVATPGAEPRASGGYAGAVLLDTPLLLLRPDLRAAEEALRRWLNVVALVRGGAEGGSVIAVGDSSGRALQALVRLDPAGFAGRELSERAEARFPPAVKLVTVEGGTPALEDFLAHAQFPAGTEALGPVEIESPTAGDHLVRPGGPGSAGGVLYRLTLRTPPETGSALVRATRDVLAIRSARKSEGALRVRVDPDRLG